jgi:hypothetical protein
MLRTIPAPVFMAAAVLGLSACAGGVAGIAETGRGGEAIAGYGLSIELPGGWQGRVVSPEADMAAQVIAGNFRLPGHEDFAGQKTAAAMSPASIYVWIADLGTDQKHLQPGRWIEASLPISVSRADVQPFEGVSSPSEAVRWLLIDGRALLILVAFGAAEPSDSQFTQANGVLATLRVTPTQ